MSNAVSVDLPMDFVDHAHEALVSLWWTSTILRRVSRRFFKSHRTSEAQFNLLMVLSSAEGPLTQNDLSRRLLVDKSNVTGLIDRMEQLGLTRRNSVPGDRRSYHITLTAKGRKLIARLETLYMEVVHNVMADFSRGEQDELMRLTHKIRTALAEDAPYRAPTTSREGGEDR